MELTNKKIFIILALIFVLALFFRFYRLTDLPPGLNSDEATNGIKAQKALQTGGFKFFYTREPIELDKRFQDEKEWGTSHEGYYTDYSMEHSPHEGLYVNLVALSLSIFGNTPWAIRAVSALMGSITILGFFLLTREFLRWGRKEYKDASRIALLSSFLLAVSFWHVIVSRLGFMHILTPAVTVFAFFFLFRALSLRAKLYDFILGGLILGLTFHTFLSNRVLPFVALTALILAFITKRDNEKLNLKRVVLYWVMWFVGAFPILLHFFKNPGDFSHRTAQVSALSGAAGNKLAIVIKNFLITLAQFNFSGDIYNLQNIPGSPSLNRIVGIFFLIGVVILITKIYKFIATLSKRERPDSSETIYLFLLIWLIAALAPGFLSSGPHPHSFRSFNAVLPATLLGALGGASLFYFAKEKISVKGAATLASIILLIVTASEYKKYFIDWASIEGLSTAHHKELMNIGYFINEAPASYKKFIITNHSPAPVQFITDTYVKENRAKKNIVYLLPNRKTHIDYYNERPYVFFALQYSEPLFKQLIKNVPGKYTYEEDFGYFILE